MSGRRRSFAYAMRALGAGDLPEQLRVGSARYVHELTIKHDFWAATGFYARADDPSDRVVLKINRNEPFLGLPLIAIGRWLCEREVRIYRALSDLPNVPRLVDRCGEAGFIHTLVPGRPLDRKQPVSDSFFPELQGLMTQVHARGIAYVDANKPQNILLGDDGRPYLIDFQISFDLATLGDNFMSRAILARLQREDIYHILKHKRKMRPDQLTIEEASQAQRQSLFIKLHRAVTKPYFMIRRPLMRWLNRTGRVLPAGSD
jgi:hypothetical protein